MILNPAIRQVVLEGVFPDKKEPKATVSVLSHLTRCKLTEKSLIADLFADIRQATVKAIEGPLAAIAKSPEDFQTEA